MRPWDWYARDAYRDLCFQTAALLDKEHERDAQYLLRRGWTSIAKTYNEVTALNELIVLPQLGELPLRASPQAISFFRRFKNHGARPITAEGERRITLSIELDGAKNPFPFYIPEGPHGLDELQDQFLWVKEMRGGIVPQETIYQFVKLWETAQKKKISFPVLCEAQAKSLR